MSEMNQENINPVLDGPTLRRSKGVEGSTPLGRSRINILFTSYHISYIMSVVVSMNRFCFIQNHITITLRHYISIC